MNIDAAFIQRAKWIGFLGVLPFAAAALIIIIQPPHHAVSSTYFHTDITRESALFALQAYAAIILTFVGAIHWGISLTDGNKQRLTVSVIPSLLGWTSLLLAAEYALLLLTASFIILFVFDMRQYENRPWFLKLRLQLTTIVCTVLLLCWYSI